MKAPADCWYMARWPLLLLFALVLLPQAMLGLSGHIAVSGLLLDLQTNPER